MFRGVHVEPPSDVSYAPIPWTIVQKWEGRSWSGIRPEIPRWPGGWFAGSSQASLPGWPASVVSSDQFSPPSLLSKIPGASTPTSSLSPVVISVETLETFRPSSSPYEIPSLECSHVSPRSRLRQTAEPCHSLAAAA